MKFGMLVIKFTRNSFERQILESVCIQQNTSHNIFNSRSEYNSSLPRLSIRLGDKEFKKYEKELENAKQKEEELERRIQEMRKTRSKNRKTRTKQINAPPKRRKTGQNSYSGETKLSRTSELNNGAAGRQDRQARQITPRMSQEETVLNIRAKLI